MHVFKGEGGSMELKKIDQIGYLILGRGYLYLNVLLDVFEFCRQSLLKSHRQQIPFEDSEEWQEFMEWRQKQQDSTGPMESKIM